MTLISINTLLVSIMLLIALYLYKKDLKDDFEFFCLTGEHLYDQEKLNERGNILFKIAIGNFIVALLNLLCLLFK